MEEQEDDPEDASGEEDIREDASGYEAMRPSFSPSKDRPKRTRGRSLKGKIQNWLFLILFIF